LLLINGLFPELSKKFRQDRYLITRLSDILETGMQGQHTWGNGWHGGGHLSLFEHGGEYGNW